MKRAKIKVIIWLCVFVVAAGAIAVSYYNSKNVLTYDYSHLLSEAKQQYEEGAEFKPIESTGNYVQNMTAAYENDTLVLYVDEKTANLAIYDKRNQQTWYSVVPDANSDPVASSKEKTLMQSQLVLKYYGTDRKEYTYDSYDKCISLGQYVIENINNGIRITYTIGNMALGVDLLPQYISEERFEELILSKFDDTTVKYLKARYFKSKKLEGFWEILEATRTSNINSKKTLELFVEAGYNEEELAIDNESAGIEMNLERISFVIPVEYRIENDALDITIPMDSVVEGGDSKLSYLEFYRMFGATGTDEKGYMFVPAGSGALINLNNGKTKEDSYTQIVYDLEPLMLSGVRTQLSETTRLPVFGMKRENGAFLGYISKGESYATIRADVSGRLNSYNYIYPTFALRTFQRLYMSSVSGSESDLTVIEEGRYNGDITVKYMFLAGGDSTYAGMANRYREELKSEGVLTKLDEKADTPFFLDIIGAAEKQNFILGVPYASNAIGTTYKQAEEIVKYLGEKGISNIQMRYMGWFNGGLYNETVKKVDMISKLGSKKDLQSLQSLLAETGGNVYPDVMFVRAPSIDYPSSYSVRNEAARSPAGQNWRIATYSPDIQEMWGDYVQQVHFINSPRAIPMQISKFMKAFEKVGVSNLALNDLADLLSGDLYKVTYVTREDSKLINMEQLEKLSGSYNLLVTGGNKYALKYTQNVIDFPIKSNNYYIVDEGVPFNQMVLHGYIDYAGTAINHRDDYVKEDILLKMIESGASPHYIMTYSQTSELRFTPAEMYFSTEYKLWADNAAEFYNTYNDIYKSIRTSEIVNHEILDSDVYRTTFSNGTAIMVNYNKTPYTAYNNITIEAKGFVVIEGGTAK